MSIWKSCSVCPMFDSRTMACYRRADEVIPVEDPSVLPEWCPQESKGRFPGHHTGFFPFDESKCKGCPGDSMNRSLPPMSCQNGLCRPLTDSCGDCPMYGLDWHGLAERDFGDDPFPAVTRRMADIIVRGINDRDMSYWEVDHTLFRYRIGWDRASRECHNFSIIGYLDGTFSVRIRQTKVGQAYLWMMEASVDHAEIDERYGYLFLFKGKSRYYNDSCLAIRIHDAQLAPVSEDDEEEESCCIPKPVPPPAKAHTTSLEAWL